MWELPGESKAQATLVDASVVILSDRGSTPLISIKGFLDCKVAGAENAEKLTSLDLFNQNDRTTKVFHFKYMAYAAIL